jgi:hypothetical protein
VLQEIIDHKKDGTAVEMSNGNTKTRQGRRIPKKTTKGRKLLCQWRDGPSDSIDLKHSRILKQYKLQSTQWPLGFKRNQP